MHATAFFFSSSVRVVALAAVVFATGCAGGTSKPAESVAEQPGAVPTAPSSPGPSHSIGESLDHFVSGGWLVFAKARADLDQDGRQDVVALVEHERSGKSVDSYPMPRGRYVMIVVQDQPFARLAVMNPKILRVARGFGISAPDVQLDAAHGEFSITQSGGNSGRRWSYTLNFQHERSRSAWYLAACSFETYSQDVRGRTQSSAGEHSYPYTLKNDLGHFDRGEFKGFCPKL